MDWKRTSFLAMAICVAFPSIGSASPARFYTYKAGSNKCEPSWNYSSTDDFSKCVQDVQHLGYAVSASYELQKVVFSESRGLAMEVDAESFEGVSLVVDTIDIDPFRGKKPDATSSIIDLSQVVASHLRKKYMAAKFKDADLEDKIRLAYRRHLSMGGSMNVVIQEEGSPDSQYVKVVPEQYGVSFFNQAVPLNVQYSRITSLTSTESLDAVNLYYPLQWIVEDSDTTRFKVGDQYLNWTTISKRFSAGLFLSATLGTSVGIKGGGAMGGLGTPRGVPLIGYGFGYSGDVGTYTVLTLNPLELTRVLLNPVTLFTE